MDVKMAPKTKLTNGIIIFFGEIDITTLPL
jgi:hypothetical protein